MKLPKGILFIIVAVAAGLMAAVGIHKYVTFKTRVVQKPMTQVVVAAAEITPGTALAPTLVKTVSWPAELAPQGAVSRYEAVKDRVVIVPLNKGEPILMAKLAPEGTEAGISGLLSNAKRAMSIRVDDVSGNAGFIKPGDHVDVLMSIQLPNDNDQHYSKTILQNLVVLSCGQIWEQQQKDQKPVIVKTVTLEVKPEEAEVLNLASNQGKIRLALRSRNNLEIAHTGGVLTSHLVSLPRPQETAAPPTPKREMAVEVIKGMTRSKANI
ncbi:MAG: Flp pilus assembly protein CpaB [Desulfobaccales bacterium]